MVVSALPVAAKSPFSLTHNTLHERWWGQDCTSHAGGRWIHLKLL